MSRLRRVLLPALLTILLGAHAGAGAAQGPVARITGTVTDDAGKPVAGATISATDPDHTPAAFTATTDDKGRFGMLGLRRGTWTFSIAAPGFQTLRASGEVQTAQPNPPLTVTLRRAAAPPAGSIAALTGAEIQTLIDAAEAASASGNVAGAVAGYRDLLTRVPALTTAYLRIGALLEQSGDASGALDAYRDLARVEPDNARAAAAIARLSRHER